MDQVVLTAEEANERIDTMETDVVALLPLRGRTRFDNPRAVLPSSFLPVAGEECIMCGICAKRCLMEALAIDEKAGRMVVDPERCIGCGVCTLKCSENTLKLRRFERDKPFNHIMELGMALYKENKETMPT